MLVVTVVGVGVTFAGVIYVKRTFDINRELVKGALMQAEAAVEGNKLLRDAHVAEVRPWVTLDIVPKSLHYNVNGLNFVVLFTVKNIGNTPATNVWIDTDLHAPDFGSVDPFIPANIQSAAVTRAKERIDRRLGSLVFPGRTLQWEVTTVMGKDELDRLTKEVEFIQLHLMAVASYGFVNDPTRRITSSMFEVRRSDRPRPESATKNRSQSAIFVDEGDIGASDLIAWPSLTAPPYAD